MNKESNDMIYNKTIVCPVCSGKFDVTKVKIKACRVSSRDTDFCVYYEGVNPLLYEVWVCEHCGYSALSEKFEEINTRDSAKLITEITPRWNKRSFAGERSIYSALEAFKLALYNLHVRGAKASEFAKICIRIAWLYRIADDKQKEREFLAFALRSYNETFQNERFPVDKLDEFTCMYMIAELNRRVGNLDESIKWFSRLISSPEARRNSKLVEAARDQFQLVKDEIGGSHEDREGTK